MSTKPITFSRSQDGWFFKEDKIVRYLKFCTTHIPIVYPFPKIFSCGFKENIGSYVASVYDVNGMTLVTRKRSVIIAVYLFQAI